MSAQTQAMRNSGTLSFCSNHMAPASSIARSRNRAGSVWGIPTRFNVPEQIKPIGRTPLGRTLRLAELSARGRILARVRPTPAPGVRAPIFIIGCGRSGTTVLGRMFDAHPAVRYLYEPNHLWAAIDPATDFLQLYSRSEEHHCLLDASSVTAMTQRRFSRLMSVSPHLVLVEKNPINSLRIGYLNALAPEARFVHIVRDGVDVARSIERQAAITLRRAFRPPQNGWWGVRDAKWVALERDGAAAGYCPQAARQLTTNSQRGAYEWLVSVGEVEAWRTRLGSRLCEIRYEDFANETKKMLCWLMNSLELSCPAWWLEQVTAEVRAARDGHGDPLALPDQMSTDFDRLQASFEFKGRVIAQSPARRYGRRI